MRRSKVLVAGGVWVGAWVALRCAGVTEVPARPPSIRWRPQFACPAPGLDRGLAFGAGALR